MATELPILHPETINENTVKGYTRNPVKIEAEWFPGSKGAFPADPEISGLLAEYLHRITYAEQFRRENPKLDRFLSGFCIPITYEFPEGLPESLREMTPSQSSP